jgi:hypothetical protein
LAQVSQDSKQTPTKKKVRLSLGSLSQLKQGMPQCKANQLSALNQNLSLPRLPKTPLSCSKRPKTKQVVSSVVLPMSPLLSIKLHSHFKVLSPIQTVTPLPNKPNLQLALLLL